MANLRYLIGGGEKLSEEVGRPGRGGGDKAHPYTFSEALERLTPQLNRVSSELERLPELACPGGDTVVALTLHPTYLAKSYYPAALMRELRLSHLGSRAVHITPERAASGRAAEDPSRLRRDEDARALLMKSCDDPTDATYVLAVNRVLHPAMYVDSKHSAELQDLLASEEARAVPLVALDIASGEAVLLKTAIAGMLL